MVETIELNFTENDIWRRGKKGGGNTLEHIELSNRCLAWVKSRASGKGIVGSTEVYLAKEYVADAVAEFNFQNRFEKTYGREWKGCLNPYIWTGVFEVKVSVNDYLRTFGNFEKSNRAIPMGNLHWIVTTPCLISPAKIPSFWGLLEARGRGLVEMKKPIFQEMSFEQLYKVSHELLWGRYNKKNDLLGKIKYCPNCNEEYSEYTPEKV